MPDNCVGSLPYAALDLLILPPDPSTRYHLSSGMKPVDCCRYRPTAPNTMARGYRDARARDAAFYQVVIVRLLCGIIEASFSLNFLIAKDSSGTALF